MSSATRTSTRRRCGGFSLLEAIAATGFVAITLLGLGACTIDLTRKHKSADATSAAHALVQQRLEELRSMPLGAPELTPGTYTDPANPLRADGTTGGPFRRTWTVANNTPDAGVKTVTVSITWTDSRRHTTRAAAYVRCPNIPC